MGSHRQVRSLNVLMTHFPATCLCGSRPDGRKGLDIEMPVLEAKFVRRICSLGFGA